MWINITKLPPMSKDTLTERHAPPWFDPGLIGWAPTLLATNPSEQKQEFLLLMDIKVKT